MKRLLKAVTILDLFLLSLVLFQSAYAPVSKITVCGSTTVLPIVHRAAIEYMRAHEGDTIYVIGGGSGYGYASLIDGACDIAMASRDPKEKELRLAQEHGVELYLHRIALDGLVVIVNSKVSSEPLNLTIRQVALIFAGKIEFWSDVDSKLPHERIVVFTRESGSGTRGTFEELVMEPYGLEITSKAQEVPSNPSMAEAIRTTAYSIGFIGIGFLTSDLVYVRLARDPSGPFISPTPDKVYSGEYPLFRYLYLVTNGPPKEGTLVFNFIRFVLGPEGQKIVEEEGFLPIRGR